MFKSLKIKPFKLHFVLIIFLLGACHNYSEVAQHKEVNKNLINCFDSYVNSSKENKVFYESIGILENDLIQNGMLKDKTKQSYLTMLDNLEKHPDRFKKFDNIGKYFQSTNVMEKFHYCVYKEFKKNKQSSYLKELLKSIENMEMKEQSIGSIKEFIKAIDFNEKKLRLIACANVEMGIFAKFHYNK